MCLESLCALKFEIKGSLCPLLPPKTPNGVFFTVFAIFRALKKKKSKNQDRFIFFRACSLKKKHTKIQSGVNSFSYSPGPSGLPNYPNSFWGDQLYHPHRRFFFDPKFSALEDGFVDGRARTEPTSPAAAATYKKKQQTK